MSPGGYRPLRGGRERTTMQQDATNILDDLGNVAGYVISREDHRILYYNRRVERVSPQVRVGMICHQVWPEGCQNCPLHTIGDAETSTSISSGDAFGEVVDISATKTVWEDGTPAYIITVAPHQFTEIEQQAILDRELLMRGILQIYDSVVSVDLSQDSYTFLSQYRGPGKQPFGRTGTYSELIGGVADRLEEPERQAYLSAFMPAAARQVWQNTAKDPYLQHRWRDALEEEPRWYETWLVRVQDPFGQRQLAVLLSRCIQQQKEDEQRLQEALEIDNQNLRGVCGKYIVRDQNVYLLQGSDRYFQLLDTSPSDYRDGIFPGMDPRQRRRYICMMVEKSALHEPISLEFARQKKDGSTQWLQVQFIYTGQRGNAPLYYGILVDITARKMLEKEHHELFEQLPVGVAKLLLDRDLSLLEANRAYLDILGCEMADMIDGALAWVHPDDRDQVQREVEAARGGAPLDMEMRVRRRDGTVVWVQVQGRPAGELDGVPVTQVVVREKTDRHRMRQELEDLRARYRQVIEGGECRPTLYDGATGQFIKPPEQQPGSLSGSVVFDYDLKEDQLTFSEPFLAYFGGEQRVFTKARRLLVHTRLIHPDDRAALRAVLEYCRRERGPVRCYLRFHTLARGMQRFSVSISSLWDQSGSRVLGLVGKIVHDVEQPAEESSPRRDALTGLYDRQALVRQVETYLRFGQQKLGLILVDIDDFSGVNAELGHVAGDALLRNIAGRLRRSVDGHDIVARSGGDQFALLLKGLDGREDLEERLQQVLAKLYQPFSAPHAARGLKMSIGVCCAPDEAATCRQLLARAEEAVQRAKKLGGGRCVLYGEM